MSAKPLKLPAARAWLLNLGGDDLVVIASCPKEAIDAGVAFYRSQGEACDASDLGHMHEVGDTVLVAPELAPGGEIGLMPECGEAREPGPLEDPNTEASGSAGEHTSPEASTRPGRVSGEESG